MALQFVMFALLAIAASGLGDHLNDQISLLQTSMVVESRKAQHVSSTSFGEALPTCASVSAGDMDGVSCTSLSSGVHMKSMETLETVQAHEALKPIAVEEQSTTVTTKQIDDSTEATISMLRCILNVITFLFVADIVRRLSSPNGSANLEQAVDVPSMLRASERNDVAAVKAMLDQGMPIHADDTAGRTALHVAAKMSAAAVVDVLLQRGAKVNATDSWDETALHHAARAGATDVCKSLLDSGARIDALNAQDWTPLVAAASRGQKDTCEWLLAHGATQDLLPEACLPALLQQLLKADEPEVPEPEPEFQMPNLEAKLEADLLRRALEPKPEWEEEETLPEWVAAVDDWDYDDA